jgi:hypothetical protein
MVPEAGSVTLAETIHSDSTYRFVPRKGSYSLQPYMENTCWPGKRNGRRVSPAIIRAARMAASSRATYSTMMLPFRQMQPVSTRR